jgi:hypothetical protein
MKKLTVALRNSAAGPKNDMNEKGIENAEQDREDKKFRGKEEIS